MNMPKNGRVKTSLKANKKARKVYHKCTPPGDLTGLIKWGDGKLSDADEWYLFVDVIPSIGYQPMRSNNLDSGFVPLDSPDYYLSEHTKHGGVASLAKEEYDRIASEYGLQ